MNNNQKTVENAINIIYKAIADASQELKKIPDDVTKDELETFSRIMWNIIIPEKSPLNIAYINLYNKLENK